MNEIIPGILEKDWEKIEEKLRICSGNSSKVHIDIIDGKFATNTSFLNFEKFLPYSKTLFLEAHLMVEEPVKYLDALAKAGFRRFVGHIEKMSDQVDFVVKAQEIGEVGLALDLKTSADEIKISHEDLDTILVMGVNAGFSGQIYSPGVLEKIKAIRTKSLVNIEFDGGVNDKNISEIEGAGANILISTSYLFNGDFKENFSKLSSLLY